MAKKTNVIPLKDSEINLLTSTISNEARVLYLLYLRLHADPLSQKVTIDNRQICAILSTNKKKYTQGRQITTLLIELESVGLIASDRQIEPTKSYHNKSVHLCALQMAINSPEHSIFSMYLDWHPPEDKFKMLCDLTAIIEHTYTQQELGSFKAYWITHDEAQFTSFQWTQKFVSAIKHSRLNHSRPMNQTKIGNQLVSEPKPNLSFDKNVENLLKQYSKK